MLFVTIIAQSAQTEIINVGLRVFYPPVESVIFPVWQGSQFLNACVQMFCSTFGSTSTNEIGCHFVKKKTYRKKTDIILLIPAVLSVVSQNHVLFKVF